MCTSSSIATPEQPGVTLKALTLNDTADAPWSLLMELGIKTIETRKWATTYRGDLLLTCAKGSKSRINAGLAVCVVELYDCVPMQKEHEAEAKIITYPKAYAWLTRNLRMLSRKFPVKGQLRLFNVVLPPDVQLLPALYAKKGGVPCI